MSKLWLGSAVFGLFALFCTDFALARCIEDPRRVTISGTNVARLKGYLCSDGSGDDAIKLKVEFHRLSATAARMISGKSPQNYIGPLLENPRIVPNDVLDEWNYLQKNFGLVESEDGRDWFLSAGDHATKISPTVKTINRGGFQENIVLMPTIVGSEELGKVGIDFPSIRDFSLLYRKRLPDDVRFFYEPVCLDQGDDKPWQNGSETTGACKNFKSSTLIFWRGLTKADISRYGDDVSSYNQMVRRLINTETTIPRDAVTRVLPKYFSLLKYLAGDDDLPGDFAPMLTDETRITPPSNDGCGAANWLYDVFPRTVSLDAMLIHNLSDKPVTIDAMNGIRLESPRLRESDIGGSGGHAESKIDAPVLTIAPEASILILTKIQFSLSMPFDTDDNYILRNIWSNGSISDAIFANKGAKDFSNSSGKYMKLPRRDYVFGSEWTVGAIVANGKKLDLTEKSANFTDVAYAQELGSCPYLMSWDPSLQIWVTHGKVLHAALGRGSEASQILTFAGFRSVFRLEEREPEVASIDHVKLNVVLTDGRTLTLDPDTARPENAAPPFRLFWSEAAEMSFRLPPQIQPHDVVESSFVVTGYYQRYNGLPGMARAGEERFRDAPYTPVPRSATSLVTVR